MSNKSLFLVTLALLLAVTLFFVSTVSAEEAAAANDNNEGEPKQGGGGDAAPAVKPNRVSFRRAGKRSIFQACRKDIESLCMAEPKKGEEPAQSRRVALRNAANCLETKEDEVKEDTCKAWLHARKVCFADAETACPNLAAEVAAKDSKHKLKGMAATERGRKMMCIRSADPSKLSQECSDSDFYKAIVGLRRFHKKDKKLGGAGLLGGGGKKEEAKNVAKKMQEA